MLSVTVANKAAARRRYIRAHYEKCIFFQRRSLVQLASDVSAEDRRNISVSCKYEIKHHNFKTIPKYFQEILYVH